MILTMKRNSISVPLALTLMFTLLLGISLGENVLIAVTITFILTMSSLTWLVNRAETLLDEVDKNA